MAAIGTDSALLVARVLRTSDNVLYRWAALHRQAKAHGTHRPPGGRRSIPPA